MIQFLFDFNFREAYDWETAPAGHAERLAVIDVTGNPHRIVTKDAVKMFVALTRGGGGPDNWYLTDDGGAVRQGALASISK